MQPWNMDHRHAKFVRWVTQNDGVFTRGNAFDFGITEWIFRRGLAAEEWKPYRQCYLLAGAHDTSRSQLRAALLRAGRESLATGPSALQVYGLDLRDGPDAPWKIGASISYVTVPPKRNVSIPDAVVLRDVATPQGHQRSGFPVVARERAVVDSLRVLAPADARAVLFRSLQRDWTTPERLANWSTRLRRSRGLVQLRAMAALARTGAQAESEMLLQSILTMHGISGWAANQRVYDALGLIGIVDILFAEAALAVEVDGRAWHTNHDRFENDRYRQNRLITAGYRVIRLTWEHLQDPSYVTRTIGAAIAAVDR